jgi:hypothetical protein
MRLPPFFLAKNSSNVYGAMNSLFFSLSIVAWMSLLRLSPHADELTVETDRRSCLNNELFFEN